MADEIIQVLEYLASNNTVKGIGIAYIVIQIVVAAFVLAIFVFIFRQFWKMWNDDDRPRKHKGRRK